MKNNTNIQYRQVGDYNIPNLILLPEETPIRLGKQGMMHKDYLEKHKTALFNSLLIQGKLYQCCAEIERQAQQMFDTIVEQKNCRRYNGEAERRKSDGGGAENGQHSATGRGDSLQQADI